MEEAKKENVELLVFWEIRDQLEKEDFLDHLVLKGKRENWYFISLLYDVVSWKFAAVSSEA